MERTLAQQVQEAKDQAQAEIAQFKRQVQSDSMRAKAKEQARQILLSKNPVLEQDSVVATTRINDFLRNLEAYDYDETEGRLLPVLEGKRVENAQGHAVTLDDLVAEMARQRFTFQVQDPKGNAGNQNGQQQQGRYAFKDREDYEKQFFAASTNEEKRAMAEAYTAQYSAK